MSTNDDIKHLHLMLISCAMSLAQEIEKKQFVAIQMQYTTFTLCESKREWLEIIPYIFIDLFHKLLDVLERLPDSTLQKSKDFQVESLLQNITFRVLSTTKFTKHAFYLSQ